MPDRADRADRDLDLVLLGATGFTGGLTADYLAEHAPSDLRWALAGRSADKLAAVRDRLAAVRPELADLELVTVDSTDTVGLRAVAARTRVFATTVGPYVAYGEPLVAACAAEGTDYLDLTGEPEFVDRMYVAHHDTAVGSGARIVHACGFDSIPHDLGVLHAVRRLGDDEPITAYGVVRAVGTFSGGTFHSAIGAFSRAGEMRRAHAARRAAEPRPEGRRSRAVGAKPRRDGFLGLWLLPLPTIDPMVVARSGAALASYGPDFRYSHFAGCKTLRYAVGGAVGVGALGVAAQVPPLRSALLSRIKQGDGPDEKRRERSRFSVDVVATTASGARVHSRVSGGDPGYTETAKMLAESALCLLRDDNPPSAGQVTTAQAMGDALLARLEAAGMRFESIA